MDAREFTDRLSDLDGTALLGIAADLDAALARPDGELTWWRAHLAIHEALKAQGGLRTAGAAAQAAADAVVRAAAAAGLPLPDERVTRVAREAQEIARGLVAGPSVAALVAGLLAGWPVSPG